MVLTTGSIILATAFYLGETCEGVFKEVAYLAYPASKMAAEEVYMDKLATSACKTENPDIIWSIVSTESAFRFRVIRINDTKEVLVGDRALAYLKHLRGGNGEQVETANVDIGAMQLNYYWHRDTFEGDPFRMMDPARQVAYLTNVFQPSLVKQCAKGWIGCYHNLLNKDRAKGYETLILRSKNLLDQKSHDYQEIVREKEPFRALSHTVVENADLKNA